MRLLSAQQIQEAFRDVFMVERIGTFWAIMGIAKRDDGIALRGALELVRLDSREVTVFVEKILQPIDLDDGVYVIDMLAEQIAVTDWIDKSCLSLLQAWRAKTLMQIVIEKRNAMNRVIDVRTRDVV